MSLAVANFGLVHSGGVGGPLQDVGEASEQRAEFDVGGLHRSASAMGHSSSRMLHSQ